MTVHTARYLTDEHRSDALRSQLLVDAQEVDLNHLLLSAIGESQIVYPVGIARGTNHIQSSHPRGDREWSNHGLHALREYQLNHSKGPQLSQPHAKTIVNTTDISVVVMGGGLDTQSNAGLKMSHDYDQ